MSATTLVLPTLGKEIPRPWFLPSPVGRGTSPGFRDGVIPERMAGPAQPAHVKRTTVVAVGRLDSAGFPTRFTGCGANYVPTLQSAIDSRTCLTNELDTVRITLVPPLSALSTLSAMLGGVSPRLRTLRLRLGNVARSPVLRPSLSGALVVGGILGIATLTMSLVGCCVGLRFAGLTDVETSSSGLRCLQNVERSRSAALGAGWGRLLLHRGTHSLAVSRPRPVDAGCGGFVLPQLYQECEAAFA